MSAPSASNPSDALNLSLTALRDALAAGTLSATDVAMQVVERAQALKALNAFITYPDEAFVAQAAGKQHTALAGAPIAVKDNIDTVDLPTTAGSPALRNWRPVRDADVVVRLRVAGGLVAGKTNMHEMAGGMTSANDTYGAVANPYDVTAHGGGSSGGSAVAVAARIVPAALGTDTGGSVMNPAAMCGIWGFRPTVGRVSQRGVVPLSHTRDTVGWLARAPEDLILLDLLHADVPANVQSLASLAGLRLGVPRMYFQENLEPDVAEAFAETQARLKAAGVVLVEADLSGFPELANCGTPIILFERTRELAAYLASHGSSLSITDVYAASASSINRGVVDRLAAGIDTAEDYRRALMDDLPRLKAAYAGYFKAHNLTAMLTPAAQLTAKPLDLHDTVLVNGKPKKSIVYAKFTIPPTAAQLPGLSVPAVMSARGMPAGALLIGPSMSDGTLLGLGPALAQIFPALPPPTFRGLLS